MSRQSPVYPGFLTTAVSTDLVLQVIGGTLLSGVDCIRYASSLTPTKVWDPEVDTTGYDVGLGRGWLYINGQRQSKRVLIRHDFAIRPRPIPSGAMLRGFSTVTLTYSGTNFTAYVFDWL